MVVTLWSIFPGWASKSGVWSRYARIEQPRSERIPSGVMLELDRYSQSLLLMKTVYKDRVADWGVLGIVPKRTGAETAARGGSRRRLAFFWAR